MPQPGEARSVCLPRRKQLASFNISHVHNVPILYSQQGKSSPNLSAQPLREVEALAEGWGCIQTLTNLIAESPQKAWQHPRKPRICACCQETEGMETHLAAPSVLPIQPKFSGAKLRKENVVWSCRNAPWKRNMVIPRGLDCCGV